MTDASPVLDVARLRRFGALADRAVQAGDLPGYAVSVHDGERTVYTAVGGERDVEAALPVDEATRYRIWSLSKPIVAVAAMVLVERGELDLRAPLAEFVPEFADASVLREPTSALDDVVPLTTPPALWHLATHTAGLTYSFFADAAAARHRAARIAELDGPLDLAATCAELARIPLLFQPGSAWNYSVGIDVLGRVIEVISGRPLDAFLADEVLGPLGMTDTGFVVPPEAAHLVAPLHAPSRTGARPSRATWADRDVTVAPVMLSGGGGLYSTLPDYQRFGAMLARGGWSPSGRLLGPRTVAYMSRNHLPTNHSPTDHSPTSRSPSGADLAQLAVQPLDGDLTGLGHGLGVAMVRDAVARRVPSREGQFWWNGAGGGTFVVDPTTGVSAVFLTSLRSPTNVRWETGLHSVVHQALLR